MATEDSKLPEDSITEAMASALAEFLIRQSPLQQPFGGEDWPQKSGYEIRLEIHRSTKTAILRAIDANEIHKQSTN